MGLLLQRAAADAQTGDIQLAGIDVPQPNPTIAAPDSGKDLMFAPVTHVSMELMTPGLQYIPFVPDFEIPGRPRLFAHGDVAVSFAQEYNVTNTGDVGDFVLPEGVTIPREFDVLGQGSRGQAQVDSLAWSAGVGVAITLDVFERRVRIKPSFEWIREKIDISLEVRRLQKISNATPFVLSENFRHILLSDSKKKVFHGIGPGLEIEVDSKRAGPFVVSAFMGARLHRIMGSLKVDLEPTNEAGEEAELHYRNNRWAYQAFLGIRVRLVPE